MDLETFLTSLEGEVESSGIRLGVAWLEDRGARIAASPLERQLEEDVQAIIKKAVHRLRREGDQPLQPGGDLSRGSFGRMTLQAATTSGLLHGALSDALSQLQDFATADPITLQALHDELPSFYSFICYLPDERVVLFGRRLNPTNIARRGALRMLIGDEAVLKRFDAEIIIFDDQIDWVFADDEFLVLRAEQLEATFVDPQRLLERTRANAGAINAKVPIENFADFERRCLEMPTMQTRLARIVSSDEWQSWQPDAAALKAYSARYGNIVDWDKQSGKIKFDGQPRRQWNILKLLDQAFYTGELTQTQYEATGKQSVHP
jgi:hypothetical protein